METQPTRLEDWLQAGLFAAFLTLPLLDLGLGLDPTEPPPRESITTQLPEHPADLGSLASWPERFDAYYRDHFGWRSWLIRHLHQLNYLVFRVSEAREVVVGRDGWLYYGATAIDYQRANRPFTNRQRKRWFGSVQRRQEWLERQGIEYLFAIAPNKHEIYPEHLPAKLERTGEETRWQLLSRLLRLHTPTTIVDLHAPLLAARRHEQVYERTGSHWNARGDYIVYSEIFAQLVEWFPRLERVPWEQIEWADRGDTGLALMLGVEDIVDEPLIRPGGGVRYPHSSFRRLRTLATDQDDPSLPRAVIFHDSFMVPLAPYLSEHFSHAVYQWHPSFDGRLIQRVRPDVVIELRVERRLQLNAIPNILPRLESGS
jgi:hypothetical protein